MYSRRGLEFSDGRAGDRTELPEGSLQSRRTGAHAGRPGGSRRTSREEFSRVASHPSEEFYSEYDVGDPAGTGAEPFSFTYGEHVEACAGINYAPFVERAEHRARLHHGQLVVSGAAKLSFAVLRRDWSAVPDNLVVVVVYFRA